VRTWLTPMWGFYGFFAAALLSLVGSHLVMFFQRKIIFFNRHNEDGDTPGDGDTPEDEDGDDKIIPLTAMSGISTLKPLIHLIIPSVTFAVLLVTGFFVNVMSFSYETQEGINTVNFSLRSLGLKILDAPLPTTSKSGPMFMSVMYFIMGLVIPLLNLIIFVVLYLYPMKKDYQKTTFYLAEITFAWGTSGPLIFSLLSASSQVPKFANSIIGENCDDCFEVEGELKWTVILFLIGAIGHGLMAFYLMHKAHGVLYPPIH